ncbi:MAG: hypothetical protein K2M07_05435 [Muribaculaceae bacterium]|nr:hypothetical protein [Muribaculaceae bacterium]
MTRTEEQISFLLKEDAEPAQRLQTARDLMTQFPFFMLPAIVMLTECRHLLSDNECKALTIKVALSDPGHAMLFDILSDRAEVFRDFYPPEDLPARMTTDDAIDVFLQRYGGGKDNREETELLERLIFNPVPDYATVLEQKQAAEPTSQEKLPSDSREAMIEEFIRTHSPEKDVESPASEVRRRNIPEPSPDSLLSETLAKFHVRRKQYDKALEIFNNLIESHPRKAAQYEAQIRFLTKLIRNQQLGR